MFNCILQWPDEMQQVYPGNCTAQLTGNHVGKMAAKIRKDLVLYMRKHMDYATNWKCYLGMLKNEF